MPSFLGALDTFVGGDDVILGARHRRQGGGGRYGSVPSSHAMGPRASAAHARANKTASLVNPDVPGAPARDAALLPAGLGTFAFVLATGTATLQVQSNLQTPFRGQRMTAVVIRNGTSAGTTAPLLNLFQVGQKPIIVSGNAIGLEVFAQNAFDTNLLLPPTIPGVLYTVGINLFAALTTTDSLTCIVGLLGSAVL